MSVLDVAAGTGATSRYLARELGATVTAADADPARLAEAGRLAAAEGLAGKVLVAQLGAEVPFADEAFDAVLSTAPLEGGPETFLARFGPKARLGGGIAFVHPCRVGRKRPDGLAALEKLWGLPLRTPAETLLLFHDRSFEPIAAEAIPDEAVDAFVADVQAAAEKALASSPAGEAAAPAKAREAALLLKKLKGAVAYTMFVGRRLDETGLSPGYARRTRE